MELEITNQQKNRPHPPLERFEGCLEKASLICVQNATIRKNMQPRRSGPMWPSTELTHSMRRNRGIIGFIGREAAAYFGKDTWGRGTLIEKMKAFPKAWPSPPPPRGQGPFFPKTARFIKQEFRFIKHDFGV